MFPLEHITLLQAPVRWPEEFGERVGKVTTPDQGRFMRGRGVLCCLLVRAANSIIFVSALFLFAPSAWADYDELLESPPDGGALEKSTSEDVVQGGKTNGETFSDPDEPGDETGEKPLEEVPRDAFGEKIIVEPQMPHEEPEVVAVEVEEPAVRTLAHEMVPPGFGFSRLERYFVDRVTSLKALDIEEAERATEALLDLRAELDVTTLPRMAMAVLREGQAHLERGDTAGARASAELAVEMAPDQPGVHWFLARTLITDSPGQILEISTSAARATWLTLAGIPEGRIFIANLLASLFLGLLLSSVIVIAILFLRSLRLFLHDFHHLFPRGASRLHSGVLAVALFGALALLHVGVMLLALIASAIAWLYAGLRERVLLAVALVLMAVVPFMASLISGMATFWGSPAEAVWLVDRTDDAHVAAPLIERRIDAGEATWIEMFALARYYKREGRLEQAALLYEAAGEVAPREASVHNNLGVVLYAQGDVEGAASAFRRATELQPGFAGAWYNLSKAHFRLGERLPGREARRRAVDMEPELLRELPDQEDRLNLALSDARLTNSEILRLATVEGWREEMAIEVTSRVGGLVPPSVAPLLPLAALPLFLSAGVFLARRRPSSACSKCGRSVCERCDPGLAGGRLCAECVNIFQTRKSVSASDRAFQESKVRRYQRWREVVGGLLGLLLPGAGQTMLHRPIQGAVLLAVLSCGLVCVLLWFGPFPSVYATVASGINVRVIAGCILIAGAWLVGNWLFWWRDR